MTNLEMGRGTSPTVSRVAAMPEVLGLVLTVLKRLA